MSRRAAAILITLLAGLHSGDLSAQRGARARALPPIGSDAVVVLSPDNVGEALTPPTPISWKPASNLERPRGGIDSYRAAAPAVVVVRTRDGHGSGFFVSSDGLLITNHHVIGRGLDHGTDYSSALIYTGRLGASGVMSLNDAPLRAALLKTDPVRDLALLKVVGATPSTPFPFLKLSATAPAPGQDCSILGHPSSGMLWTYRPCQVASIGSWPKDLVNLVMPRLAATGAARAQMDEFVAAQAGHRIMLTSAQANPGDSGGPVIDASGALIGVTFAGPGNQAEDKFTYHVHLDEARAFISSVPSRAMLLVPNPWDLPIRVELRDVDGDGAPDVLAAGSGEKPEVLLLDLDQNSPRASSSRDVAGLARGRRWDFEVGLDLRGAGYIAYYDTDNDGTHDAIMVTNEDSPAAQGRFTRNPAGTWSFGAVKDRPLLDPRMLVDQVLGQRLTAVLQRLRLN